jgi:hypothetical protein
MPSNLDHSNSEGRKHCGVAFICGSFVQVLLMGGALFLGVLFPAESLAAHQRYALIGLQEFLTPPENLVVKSPTEAVRVRVPKLKLPETSKLWVSLPVADLEVSRIWHTIPSGLVPDSPLPAPPVGLVGPPPKKHIVVHTGLFGGAAGTLPTKRPVEKVQTGVFGSFPGFPERAQGENPGNVPNSVLPGLPAGPGEGNGTGRQR